MSSKSELLNQLKIDRSEKEPTGRISILVLILLMLLSAGIGGVGGWSIFRGENSPEQVQTAKALPAATSSSNSRSNSLGVASSRAKSIAATVPVKNNSPASVKILNASGYITARRMATVSSEVMGLLTEINVEEGMAVKKGQVLARLDNAVAMVNYKYAQAQKVVAETRIGRIKVNLAEAKRVLKRSEKLNVKNFSSAAVLSRAQADMEGLEADLMTARADIRVAELEVERQKERLDDHTIRAPFDGVVTVKNAQPGEIVAPASAGGGFTRTGICTIVDMTSLEIEVDVNEAFIGRVFAGQKVESHLDAYPDWIIPASVIAVIPTADRAKATVRVRIGINIKDDRILPDMGVKVAFLKN